MPTQTFSSSSMSYTSSVNGEVSGYRSAQQTHSDGNNTTVTSAHQGLNEPVTVTSQTYDAQGKLIDRGNVSGGGRIEDVSDEAQKKRDEEYLERMEEEYAKREGGA
ncbi:hypothetical protein K470DRAFT_272915 [Piedraia hortae CBS 480.64]|uniref:Uncharacterized protein n=1 Tax=Piedraia hortae CBS 480.64 TaxID=1314780 RepID=A0A6A7BRH7_9PEZI|nr:hypothetical protein K470DRAFT_272915 [Piedraia hortae CBS 480.64]